MANPKESPLLDRAVTAVRTIEFALGRATTLLQQASTHYREVAIGEMIEIDKLRVRINHVGERLGFEPIKPGPWA